MSTAERVHSPHTYISIGAAADRLGVHPETLRRWDRDGTLPASRTPGNARRYRVADVETILKERNN
jgi:excisionase family DNA binding protein